MVGAEDIGGARREGDRHLVAHRFESANRVPIEPQQAPPALSTVGADPADEPGRGAGHREECRGNETTGRRLADRDGLSSRTKQFRDTTRAAPEGAIDPFSPTSGSVVGWPALSSAQPSGIGLPSRACFITSLLAMVLAL